MRLARYPEKACKNRKRQQNVSQKKRRIEKKVAVNASESRGAVTRALLSAITLDGTSNVSSPLTDPMSRGKGSSSRSNSNNSSKENRITVPSKTSKYISKTTRQTPQQVLKANMEINEMKEVRSQAYGWALDALNEPSNQRSA
jgi:hypothetical protein